VIKANKVQPNFWRQKMNAHITQSLQVARRAAFAPFIMPLSLPAFSQVPGALMLWLLLGVLSLPTIAAAGVVFEVQDTRDLGDLDLRDGECKTNENTCTLRAAIEQVNILDQDCAEYHRITLSAGTYILAPRSPALGIGLKRGMLEPPPVFGLKKLVCVHIEGTEGPQATIIDGNSTKGQEGTNEDRRPTGVFLIGRRGYVILADITIMGGHLHSPGGGAIANNGRLTISNSFLHDNSTHGWGGAIYNTGSLSILETTVSKNWSRPNSLPDFNRDGNGDRDIDGDGIADLISGGGLANFGGSVSLRNVTISGNSGGGINPHTDRESEGDGGGGILNVQEGTMVINNSTVAYNISKGVSGSYGGGIFNDRKSTISLSNTIVATNSYYKNEIDREKEKTSPNDCQGTLESSGYNLVGVETLDGCRVNHGPGDKFGSSVDPLDPKLGKLTIENGGPTPTHALLHAFPMESPAIDAGNPDPAGDGACAEHDQRYVGRPQDGPERGLFDGVRICDIGAYELWPSELSVGDVEITEGDDGRKEMVFEFRLSHPSDEPITVSYETNDQSANAGSDYDHAVGEVRLEPGVLQTKVPVNIVGDRVKEDDEIFIFGITDTTGLVKIVDHYAVGTIKNDD
jgi:Calx-beta domain